jgi:pyruvate formate lyase activating enzyme
MSLFFDIKRYSVNDGPGIRITLFLKGCPLSCVWCHNPEGISPHRQKMYARRKCIGCRSCVGECPNGALKLTQAGIVSDPDRCNLCGRCADACPAKAIEMAGTAYDIDFLINEIEKETVFIDRSGGGVTFCGGEPLMHPDVLTELLRRCRALEIHRAVDTTLYASPQTVARVMAETDLFLVDLKLMDTGKHRYYCGTPNEPILANLRTVVEAGKDVRVRIPLIEGINADADNIARSAAFLASLPSHSGRTVHLLPYHDTARSKHERLGSRYNPEGIPMATPSAATVEQCKAIFREFGIEAVTGG